MIYSGQTRSIFCWRMKMTIDIKFAIVVGGFAIVFLVFDFISRKLKDHEDKGIKMRNDNDFTDLGI